MFGLYSTEEKDAAQYVLPDPLLKASGERIATAAEWELFQREYILSLLKKYEYGEVLPRPDHMEFQLLSRKENALNGKAIRKEVQICCSMRNGKTFSFLVLLYIPNFTTPPVPAFAGLNFEGNHNTTLEEDVRKTGFRSPGVLFEENRGTQHSRWIPETLVSQGYATATCCYHDIYPDRADGGAESALRLFGADGHEGETYSVIGTWAWGLSRIMDYLESEPEIDSGHVAVHGHSRLGKTALWAGAIDRRFKMVIANDSGCGGASLHKRKIGENISLHFQWHLEHNLPCWFRKELERFMQHEEDLPVDQHELLAMIAPRPLAIGTATEDRNADQKGEFLACQAASEVYQLYGSREFPASDMPGPGEQITGDISFHSRSGRHDQTPEDWKHYLNVADQYLKPKEGTKK